MARFRFEDGNVKDFPGPDIPEDEGFVTVRVNAPHRAQRCCGHAALRSADDQHQALACDRLLPHSGGDPLRDSDVFRRGPFDFQ